MTDAPYGIIAKLPVKIAEELRRLFPDLLEPPGQRLPDGSRVQQRPVDGRDDVVALLNDEVLPELPATDAGTWRLILPAVTDMATIPVVRPDGSRGSVRLNLAQLAEYLRATGLVPPGRTLSVVPLVRDHAAARFIQSLAAELGDEPDLTEDDRRLLRLARSAFADDPSRVLGRFITLRFPMGVFLHPGDRNPFQNDITSWVETGLRTNANTVGAGDWNAVWAGLEVAGTRGLVLAPQAAAQHAVVLEQGPGRTVRLVIFEPGGPVLHRLTEVPADFGPPPQQIMVFDHCSGLLSGPDGKVAQTTR